mgnify:CR=1 FL=1
MKVEITDESHNRVDWQVRWPVVWIELALLLGLSVLAVFMLLSTHPARWIWLAGVGGFLLIVGVAIGATTPMREDGYLERLPDGGELRFERVWLGIGRRTAVALPFEELEGFLYETQDFRRTEQSIVTMGRLWVTTQDRGSLSISVWGKPASIEPLANALSKAARCPLEVDDGSGHE